MNATYRKLGALVESLRVELVFDLSELERLRDRLSRDGHTEAAAQAQALISHVNTNLSGDARAIEHDAAALELAQAIVTAWAAS
jgi:hypothetical protein